MKAMGEKNINETLKYDLCVSCGICEAACPANAIKMKRAGGKFIPSINASLCTMCKICIKLCPGIDIENEILSESDLLKENEKKDLPSYTVADKCIEKRFNSTSGGFVGVTLNELLKKKKYEGAFVCENVKGFDKEIFLKLIINEVGVLDSVGSKYIQVSAKKVVEYSSTKKDLDVIIVGTPCVLLGLKKYFDFKNINTDKALFIGLFCDCTLNNNFVEYIYRLYSNGNKELANFTYRSKVNTGWPGNMVLKFKSKEDIISPSIKRMEVKKYFSLFRCACCIDKLNSIADISCGDCYIDGEKSFYGLSNIIVRTKKGKNVFDEIKEKLIHRKINYSHITASQKLVRLFTKKSNAEFINSYIEKGLIPQYKNNKELLKIKKMLEMGKNKKYTKIKLLLKMRRIKTKLKGIKRRIISLYGKIKNKCFNLYDAFVLLSVVIKNENKIKHNVSDCVVIVGGGLVNKGAQAMTFHLINQIRKGAKCQEIYLFSSTDYRMDEKEKEKFKFNIVRWDYNMSRCYLGTRKPENLAEENAFGNIKSILSRASAIYDVNGFCLSSQHGVRATIKYLLHIHMAKQYNTPMYILPQSFGPFDYSYLYRIIFGVIMKKIIPYPKTIIVREKQGYDLMEKYRKSELHLCPDMVLTAPAVDLKNIYVKIPNMVRKPVEIGQTVAIIPNARVAERIPWNKLEKYYKTCIDTILRKGKKVIILRHSGEDLQLCEKLKYLYLEEKMVTLYADDFNKFELEDIIRKCEFVVASRYHAVVHAYRNVVPAVVYGWAIKYTEIMRLFRQEQFYEEITKDFNAHSLQNTIMTMMLEKEKNKKIIEKCLLKARKISKPMSTISYC
ncbi:MAG: Coenzyme F420 hydrogenase/dehydrogenase, beta subunit C-terminal domain [bacterium]